MTRSGPLPRVPTSMGEHFLHEAHALLGEDALAAALLELYRLSLARDSLLPGTEGEIYQVFLRNTPAGPGGGVPRPVPAPPRRSPHRRVMQMGSTHRGSRPTPS